MNDQGKPVKPSRPAGAARERYERYRAVIDPAARQATFAMSELREQCKQLRMSFITRVVNELVREGWLLQEDREGDSQYRWNPGRGTFPSSRWLEDKIFGDQVLQQPACERPREKLIERGAEQLSTSELLAILIRSGVPGESAVAAGEAVARHFDGRLDLLPSSGRNELKELSRAIHVPAWCQIMAGIELGRRVGEQMRRQQVERIQSTADAIRFCENRFARLITDARQEEFHIVTLDTKNQVIDTHQITIGTLDASLVHPREVFRAAIRDSARSILLVHNHPSGDPAPSKEDFQVTRRLEDGGKILGIDVLDHIVLGAFKSISLREYA